MHVGLVWPSGETKSAAVVPGENAARLIQLEGAIGRSHSDKHSAVAQAFDDLHALVINWTERESSKQSTKTGSDETSNDSRGDWPDCSRGELCSHHHTDEAHCQCTSQSEERRGGVGMGVDVAISVDVSLEEVSLLVSFVENED